MPAPNLPRLNTAQIRALSRTEILSLTLSDFSRRDASGHIVWNELTSTQIGYLCRFQVVGMTVSNLRAVNGSGRSILSDLDRQQVQWLARETVKSLGAADLGVVDASGRSVFSELTSRQMRMVSADTIRGLGDAVVRQIDADTLRYCSSGNRTVLSELSGTQVRVMTAGQVSGLDAGQLATIIGSSGKAIWNELSSTQIGALNQGQILCLSIARLRSLNGSGRTILSDLTAEQVSWLGAYTVTSFTASDLASTDLAGAVLTSKLTAAQVRQLTARTVAALSAAQLGSQDADGHALILDLDANQFRQIAVASARQLDPAVVQQFKADHLQATLGGGKSLLQELAGEQVRHLSLAQVAGLNAAQLRSVHADGATIASELVVAGKKLGVWLAEDSGASASDGITRVAKVRVTGLEAGRAWQYSLDGGTRWLEGSGTGFDLQADPSRNLLVNPDFLGGSVGFRTDYRLQAQAGGAGTLAVVTSPPAWGLGISSGLGGAGDAFLMVDGSSRSDQAFWKQLVELEAGTACVFSFHAGNGSDPAPRLQLFVNGVATGKVQTLPAHSGWIHYSVDFTAPASGPVELALKNLETSSGGNDFGIDGLSLFSQSFQSDAVQVRQTQTTGDVLRGSNHDTWTVDATHPEPTLTFGAINSHYSGVHVEVGRIDAGSRWDYSTDGGASWRPGHGGGFELASGTYRAGDVRVRSTDVAGNESVASNSKTVQALDLGSREILDGLSRAQTLDLGVDGLVKVASANLRDFVLSKLESSLVKTAAQSDLQPQHGAILKFFQTITANLEASGKTLSEQEFTDLRLLTNYIGAETGSWTHLYNACNSLVNGDGYNAWWMNGRPGTVHPDALGNLGAGSSATQLQRLTATWLLGQNNPRSGVYSGIEQIGGDVTNPPVPSLPLFGTSGMPQINDITQKYFGDCYLMAAIGGLVDAAPGYVKSLFADYGQGVYGVRWMDHFYTLDTSFNSSASIQEGKPIWATLLEKAYAEWRIEQGVGTNYMGIAWGAGVDTVPINILGRQNVEYNLRGYEAANAAIDSLARGGSAFLASEFNIPGLSSPHAYTVVDYDAATSLFTLRNPWGSQSGGWNEGHIQVGYHTIGSARAHMVSTRRSVEEILLDRQPVAELLYRPGLDIDDTGVRPDDGVTRDASIGARLVEPGTNLMLRIDGGEWTPAGRSTFDNNTVAAREGRHTYELMTTDGRGRNSPISEPIAFTLDTRAPEKPALSVARSEPGIATVRVSSMEPGNLWEYSSDHGHHWQAGGAADGEGMGVFKLAAPTRSQPCVDNGDFEAGLSGWRSDYDNIGRVTGATGGQDDAIGFYDRNLRDTSGRLDICRTAVDLPAAGNYRLTFDCSVSTYVHPWYPWDFINVAAYVDGAPVGDRYLARDSAGWQHVTQILPALSAGPHTLSMRVISSSGAYIDIGLTLALDNLQLVNADGAPAYGKGELQVRQTDVAGNAVIVANAGVIDWNSLNATPAVLAA